MSGQDTKHRTVLPIPDQPHVGLTTYDAKDPDTKYPPIRDLRPQLIKGTRQILFGGMGRLTENSIVNTKNKSHAVTAELVVPPAGAEGVIVALGGTIGGWSLYAKDGKPRISITSSRPRNA